jgi:hypothetical protein
MAVCFEELRFEGIYMGELGFALQNLMVHSREAVLLPNGVFLMQHLGQ